MLSPETVVGEVELVPVRPPGEDVAVYVTFPLPLYVGSVNAMVTCPLPEVVPVIIGASGILPDCEAELPRIGIKLLKDI